MAKRAPSNSMPWPENTIYDFKLEPSTTPTEAEEFISSLSTSDKNKEFLRLRYREGQSYTDIAPVYGISAGGVRQAIKYVIGRYTSSTAPIPSADVESNNTNTAADAESTPTSPPKKIREELKPIITAIGTTTRYRSFVYDSKARVVISSDNVSRELRNDSRYITLPDYYQIREYDLMQEFASSLAGPAKGELLTVALDGLGPFKAFKSTVKEIGLNQAWADFRYRKFAELAEEWWEREVASSLPSKTQDADSSVLIV